MRINISRWLISLAAALSIAACTPVQDNNHSIDFVIVNESDWYGEHYTAYPFTVSGEIVCITHPEYGPSVYFHPVEFTDESYIGTPLNKAAAKSLKQASMTPNVPYSIKKGAVLSEAREIGLKVCDEMYGEV
ncbi:hypothetical protein [Psychrobacter arcticus]|uniref:hypothetical protein n=1 Tax=Psychrobacter arcticus TaxID=334543 RepID=UPI0005A24C91|nr:hypothetical protein [Psychrobacter arcticus]